MKIHHIAIWVHEPELMKAFYQQHFNCACSEKYFNPAKQFTSYFLYFREGPAIEVMHKPGLKKLRDETTGYAHIAIDLNSAEEVDRMTKKLETEGVKILGKPRITGDGYYESVIADPEGNRIELVAE